MSMGTELVKERSRQDATQGRVPSELTLLKQPSEVLTSFLCISGSLCSSLKALRLTLSRLFLLNIPSRPPDPRWPRKGLGIHEVPGEYLLGKRIYLKTICMGKIFSPTSPSTRRRENWTDPEAGPLAPECSTVEEEPGTCAEVRDSWLACFPCHSAHLLHKSRFHDGVCTCRHAVFRAVIDVREPQGDLLDPCLPGVMLSSMHLLHSGDSTSLRNHQE